MIDDGWELIEDKSPIEEGYPSKWVWVRKGASERDLIGVGSKCSQNHSTRSV